MERLLGLLESVGEGGVRLHRLLAAYATLALDDAAALPVLPYLRHCVQWAGGRADEVIDRLCTSLASYLQAVGAYAEALPLFERSFAMCERVLGVYHPDTAASLNNLALLLKA